MSNALLSIPTLHPYSMYSLGASLRFVNDPGIESIVSAAWPAANRAIFVPFAIPMPMNVTKLWVCNGTSAAGNIDIGIYDHTGCRLTSTGSTAQAGTSALQVISITAVLLSPGQFYLALAGDSTSPTTNRSAPTAEALREMGVFMQETAFALPATATPAAMTSAYLPFFGLGTKWMV